MSDATCKTCPWFHFTDEDGCMKDHECRRNSPSEGDWSYGKYLAAWPVVWPDDWCGEHPGRVPQMTACLSSTTEADIDSIADRVLDRLHREMRA